MGADMTAGCILLVFLIFFGDLWIKERVEREMPMGQEKELLGGRLLLRRHHNRGAMLNLGQGRRSFVAALSLTLTVLIAVLFVVSLGHRGNRLLRVGLALLLGGAFSNTYDRLKRKYVVDYLSFGVRWKGLRRIVFNVSDFCILIGAMLSALGAD
jgi:signal peptidase II